MSESTLPVAEMYLTRYLSRVVILTPTQNVSQIELNTNIPKIAGKLYSGREILSAFSNKMQHSFLAATYVTLVTVSHIETIHVISYTNVANS